MAETPSPDAGWKFARQTIARAPPPMDDQTQLSIRIVAHLARVGPPSESGLVRQESTQQGMAVALAVTQGAVSKVLEKLVAVELVRREQLHVPGRVRRVRVYSLTRRGEVLLEEMRARVSLPRRGL